MVINPFIHIGHCFTCSSSLYHSPCMSKIHSIPLLFEGSLVVNNGDICAGGSLIAVHFGDHLWSGDHLRSGIVCGTVQYSTRGRQVWAQNNDFGAGLAGGLNQRFSFVCCTVIHWKLLFFTPLYTSLFSLCTAGPSSVLSAVLSVSVVNTNFFLPLSLCLL